VFNFRQAQHSAPPSLAGRLGAPTIPVAPAVAASQKMPALAAQFGSAAAARRGGAGPVARTATADALQRPHRGDLRL